MSNNKDFKVKNGIQPTSYFEGVGTVVSGSVGYSLGSASYDSVSFSVAAQEVTPTGFFFRSDGLKVYVCGSDGDDINEYNLSTAWDITTASYLQSFSVSAQDTLPNGVFFKPDGTKMYVAGNTGDDINEYNLSTAWDITSASYLQNFSVAAQALAPQDLFFKADGTKMYVIGSSGDSVYEYNLSTAWDISTASYLQSFSVAAQDQSPTGLFFKSDGTKLYVAGSFTDNIIEYVLSTAWDVSSASYTQSFSVASQATVPMGVYFKDDGTKMYIVDNGNDTIYQYSTVQTTAELDLSTGSVFEVTPTSDIQVTLSNPAASGTVSNATLLLDGVAKTTYDIANAVYDGVSFSVASQEGNPTGLVFNNDGTKMYLVGRATDNVYQYSLSVAYDLTTISYESVSFSIGSQDTSPTDLSFSLDGTKMYMLGNTNDSVYQYTLSTAFDVSTASYDSVSFSVSSQDTSPYGVAFNNDGTKMYVSGTTNDSIYQYTLSTAFDLSTASYDSVSFSVSSQDSIPFDITFNNDGTKMYMVGSTNDSVYQYTLSTAFDLSTALYDSISFSVVSQDASPESVIFNGSGDKMYVVGSTNDTIYQYSTATPATITYDTAIEWSGGTAPTSPAIGETDVITFSTRDGGSTYQGVLAIDGAQ